MCRFSTTWEREVSTPTPVWLKDQLRTLWCGHLEESGSQFSRITHFTSLDYRSNLHQADLKCVNFSFTVGDTWLESRTYLLLRGCSQRVQP